MGSAFGREVADAEDEVPVVARNGEVTAASNGDGSDQGGMAGASLAEVMGVALPAGGPSTEDVLKDFRAYIEVGLSRLLAEAAGAWPLGSAELAVEAQRLEAAGSADRGLGSAFPEGAALQCLQVMSGPPGPLLVKWRFVGKFVGEYCDSAGTTVKGRGQLVDIEGVCQAQVSPDKQIASTELFYNVPGLVKAMVNDSAESAASACPITGKAGVCPVLGVSAAR